MAVPKDTRQALHSKMVSNGIMEDMAAHWFHSTVDWNHSAETASKDSVPKIWSMICPFRLPIGLAPPPPPDVLLAVLQKCHREKFPSRDATSHTHEFNATSHKQNDAAHPKQFSETPFPTGSLPIQQYQPVPFASTVFQQWLWYLRNSSRAPLKTEESKYELGSCVATPILNKEDRSTTMLPDWTFEAAATALKHSSRISTDEKTTRIGTSNSTVFAASDGISPYPTLECSVNSGPTESPVIAYNSKELGRPRIIAKRVIEEGTYFGPWLIYLIKAGHDHRTEPKDALTAWFKSSSKGIPQNLHWMCLVHSAPREDEMMTEMNTPNLTQVAIPQSWHLLREPKTILTPEYSQHLERKHLFFQTIRKVLPGEELILDSNNQLREASTLDTPCTGPLDSLSIDNHKISHQCSPLPLTIKPPSFGVAHVRAYYRNQYKSLKAMKSQHCAQSMNSKLTNRIKDSPPPNQIYYHALYPPQARAVDLCNQTCDFGTGSHYLPEKVPQLSRPNSNHNKLLFNCSSTQAAPMLPAAHHPEVTTGDSPRGQLPSAHKGEHFDGVEGYSCEYCGKMFAYQYYRDKHLKYTRCVDQGNRKYPCKLCSRSFEKRDRLRIHVLHVHEKHRPHKCHLCAKSFSQSSSLNKHLRVHSGERPYKCCYCNKAFTASSILRTHIRQHSGEKPFKCKFCWKPFASHAAHDSHVRRTHGNPTNFLNAMELKSSDHNLTSGSSV